MCASRTKMCRNPHFRLDHWALFGTISSPASSNMKTQGKKEKHHEQDIGTKTQEEAPGKNRRDPRRAIPAPVRSRTGGIPAERESVRERNDTSHRLPPHAGHAGKCVPRLASPRPRTHAPKPIVSGNATGILDRSPCGSLEHGLPHGVPPVDPDFQSHYAPFCT